MDVNEIEQRRLDIGLDLNISYASRGTENPFYIMEKAYDEMNSLVIAIMEDMK